MIKNHIIIFQRSDGKLTVSFDGVWQKRGSGHAYITVLQVRVLCGL